MRCDRARELASDALDGLLTGKIREAFERHLKGCPPCRVFHDELKESLTILSELPAVEVDDGFDEEVWRRIREVQSPRSVRALVRMRAAEYWSRIGAFPGFARWSPVGVAAAVALMVAFSSSEPVKESGSATVAQAGVPAREVERLAAADESPEAVMLGEESSPDVTAGSEGEVYAGMPEAVEVFLENARELRLQVDTDRLRHSQYTYPLRRVRAPSQVGLRVTSPRVSVDQQPPESELTVISF